MSAFLVLVFSASPQPAMAVAKSKVKQSTSKTTKVKKNTFKTPDFAFPQEVATNAREVYSTATAAGDWSTALQAAMQLCVVETQLHSEPADSCMNILEEVAVKGAAPYNALAAMMQARVLVDYYNDNRWQIDQRNIPDTDVPKLVSLWDKNMFADKVFSLVKRARDNAAPASGTPLSTYKNLIANAAKASTYGFTLGDFLNLKALDYLDSFADRPSGNLIPFMLPGSEAGSTAESSVWNYMAYISDSWLNSLNRTTSGPLANTILSKCEPLECYGAQNAWSYGAGSNEPAIAYYRKWAGFYEGTETEQPILVKLGDYLTDNKDKREFRASAEKSLQKYPKGLYAPNLRYSVESMATASVNAKIDVNNLPDREIPVRLRVRNQQQMWLHAVEVPESKWDSDIDVSDLPGIGKVAQSMKVTLNETVPFSTDTVVNLGKLPYGVYALLITDREDIRSYKKDYADSRATLFRVTSMTVAAERNLPSADNSENTSVFVVDAFNGAPVDKAMVKAYERLPWNRHTGNNSFKLVSTAETGDNGRAILGDKDIKNISKLDILKGADKLVANPYLYPLNRHEQTGNNAAIFLDRSIAKPGQRVEFEAVFYNRNGNSFSLLKERDVKISLRNASNVVVDTLSLRTDSYGNVSSSFLIPEKGMLGRWRLEASLADDSKKKIGDTGFSVEEYKTPTFSVVLETESGSGTVAKGLPADIKIKGSARTYSGMPVAGAQVDLTVQYTPWRFWFSPIGNAQFSTNAVTDAEGKFEITLLNTNLKDTPFARASYSVEASVTSQAGETQRGDCRFTFGSAEAVVPEIPSRMQVAADSISFKVPVRDMLGMPQVRKVEYTIYSVDDKDGDSGVKTEMLKGEFTSPLLTLPADKLPSGKYMFDFRIAGAEAEPKVASKDEDKIDTEVILWREDDMRPPVNAALWVPENSIVAPDSGSTTSITVGSAFADQHLLCIVSNTDKVVSRNWYMPKGENLHIEVPSPADDSRIFVRVIAVRDNKQYAENITVLPASSRRELKCETVSFRDKLSAGDKERWSFRFSKAGEGAADISAMAVMTDKALDSLVPFNWMFNPKKWMSWHSATEISWVQNGTRNLYIYGRSPVVKNPFHFALPDWIYDMYGNRYVMYESAMAAPLSNVVTMSRSMVRNEMKMSKGEDSADFGAVKEEAEEEVADSAVVAGAGAAEAPEMSESPDVPLRESEMPVAFFRPSLTSDNDGTVNVEFEVPDFNTTWKFQILGYDNSLQSAMVTLDAVSAKPVMVQMNAPRFVRTSDRIVLAATLYNNSDVNLPLGGRIEVVDPLSGKVLAAKDFKAIDSAPSSSRVINMEYDVASDLSLLAIRAYALSDGNSDGEQAPLQVLPSSTPVLESTPFYLGAGEKEFKIKLPEFPGNSSVTLTYCDNPLWYCVTALPALTGDTGVSILSVLRSLYGSCIGLGLMEKYPALRSGLQDILKADSKGETTILNSPLENNPQLKIAALSETPWVNNASAETLRMHSLGELLDSVAGNRKVADIMDRLQALHRPDGGYAWCPEGNSSVWATTQTLLYNAMLGRFGYMPSEKGYRKNLTEALEYVEREWLDGFKKHKPTDSDIESLRNLLYVRSYYRQAGMLPTESREFKKYAAKCLELVAANWRGYDIYDKATAATLLAREGNMAEARTILKSLSQFATRTQERGMWFDSLAGDTFSPWNKLITTTQVLEAYIDIDPKSADVDALRQWLLLQRQAEDWSAMSYGAELVQGVLSCGADWSASAARPQITVGGKKVIKDGDIPSYGEVTINLDTKKASGATLSIKRDADSPAWGGVICQYVAPIDEVKAAGTMDVRVRKDIYLLREVDGEQKAIAFTGEGEGAPRKGDLVRVLLTVENERDMEYVVLADERAACLEPVESLSGRDMKDGVWLYREVRNAVTNFFIPYLRKGSFQISYDCRLSQEGDFTAGIATLQSQYAPTLTGHSAGKKLSVSAR